MTIPDQNDIQQAARESSMLACDIVMAGGVTSGIIYPGAVAMIARRYVFRSIGGTSVGAMAAAATAAAEYGRLTGGNPNAFEQIGALPDGLSDFASDGHSRLFHLFTAEPPTEPLLALVTPLFGGGGWFRQGIGLLRATLLVWQIATTVVVAALAGLWVVVRLAEDGHTLPTILGAVAGCALLVLVWLVAILIMLLRLWLPAWKANGYGICTGLAAFSATPQSGIPPFEGLTAWMHRVVQTAAGRKLDDAPLTFGDLWNADDKSRSQSDPNAPRAIELSMIASDISRNRTVQLPFIETPSPIYVDTAELARYLPARLVKWMVDHPGAYEDRIAPDAGVIRLPQPQDLPIVFAARLSLSFPVLLSAFPLLTPDFGKKNADDRIPLRRLWLSDGGLTSNFPIHFFDDPIPSRPTFCLNLVAYEASSGEAGAGDDGSVPQPGHRPPKAIALPRAPERSAAARPKSTVVTEPKPGDKVWDFISMAKGNQFLPALFTAFDTAAGTGILPFATTLLNTARFWSDNQLLLAPGVRDRVVSIALREDEGGLNLDMTAEVIADLNRRGRAAGLLISARFDPQARDDPETGLPNVDAFPNHRWVRFRSFMAAFEDMSRRFVLSRRASDAAAAARQESQLDTMMRNAAPEKLGYPAPKRAEAYYQTTTRDLQELALTMAAATRKDEHATFDMPRASGDIRAPDGAAPRPKMRLQVRPLVDNDPRAEQAELP
jgi:hypothetical protein